MSNEENMKDTETKRAAEPGPQTDNETTSKQENPFEGKYEIKEELKEKGGETYYLLRAKRLEDSKDVVIKIYNHGIQVREDVREFFSESGKQNIMPILEYGTFSEKSSFGLTKEYYYEIMPYALGSSLKGVRITEIDELKSLIQRLAVAIQELHKANIIHRDIKPSNILFLDEAKEELVLSDFGTARPFDPKNPTSTATMARTIGYAAPEQNSGAPTMKSDYFSFGITLLEIINGIFPFKGNTEIDIIRMIQYGDINIPNNLPGNLTQLIKGLLIKNPEHRYGYEDVQDWLEDRPLRDIQSQATNDLEIIDIYTAEIKGGDYYFDDNKQKRIPNLSQLVEWIREEPEQSLVLIRRNTIANMLRVNGDLYKNIELTKIAEKLENLKETEQDEETLFLKTLYALQERPKFLGKYGDIPSLVEFLSNNREEYKELIYSL